MNVDPVVSEIVAGALRAIEEEIEGILGRVWRSPSLQDAGDFSAALYDRFGRALTGRVLGASPLPILSACPGGDIRPGDVFLHNDPYLPPAGLGEAPDLRLTLPIFDGDRLIAFLQVRGRHDDLGGIHPGGMPAGSSEIFHEGLLIPPVRIAREAGPVADVRSILLRNSRRADVLADDLEAQLGALRVGALRLRDLVRRYGADQLTACFADLLRECELAFRRELLPNLPEGRWEAEAALETDGFTGPHLLRLALEREGENLILDLNGTGPQARGPINCPLEGEGRLFLARLVSPLLMRLAGNPAQLDGITLNDGACRVLDVRLPGAGTLVTPRFPAPAGLRVLTLGRLLSAFGEALFRATGGKTPAGFDNLRMWSLNGLDSQGVFHLFREAPGAGMGASPLGDGGSAIPPINGSGGLPVEMIEARYPLRVESAGLVRDSGGAGAHRGGLGVYREYRLLLGGTLSSGMSCHAEGPAGGRGGRPGGPCRMVLAEGKKKPQPLPPLASAHPFAPGSLLRVETPGGGGWGDPKERDPEAVRLDVLRGYVSPEAAREVYGAGPGNNSHRNPEPTRGTGGRKAR